jgi:hypothetical protein
MFTLRRHSCAQRRSFRMALLNVLLSGSWRMSGTGGESAARAFSAVTPSTLTLGSLSMYVQRDIVLATTQSEFRFSIAELSSPQLILAVATGEVRINFAGQASSFSAASASVVKFKDFFGLMDVSGSLPSGFSIGNSGTDSATVTVLVAG